MYNLILIDDEILTLNMLKNYINWSDYDFNLVGCFSSALAALEYVKKNPVHAVITDINIPDMDGLELITKLKESFPNIAVGFISAHRKFDYALTAANMDCCGYILKPILRKDLCTLCEKLNKYAEESNRISSVSSVQSMNKDNFTFESFEMQFKCQQILSDILYGVLIDEFEIDKNFQSIGIDIRCECYSCIMEITIPDFNNYATNIWKHSSILLYNAIGNLSSYNATGIHTLPIAYYKDKFLIIMIAKNGFNHIFREKSVQITAMIVQNLRNILQLNVDISSSDVFDNLKGITTFLQEDYLIYQDNDSLIQRIISYTKENYANITSIHEVAEYFHFSPIYFGRCFQKKTNKSFKSYLNELKVEKAKELLVDSNMKIASIAFSLGFKNESYFYTVFKNITGKTPNQYRYETNIL